MEIYCSLSFLQTLSNMPVSSRRLAIAHHALHLSTIIIYKTETDDYNEEFLKIARELKRWWNECNVVSMSQEALVSFVGENCPKILSFLKSSVLTPQATKNKKKNTDFKLKSAILGPLMGILYIRSQKNSAIAKLRGLYLWGNGTKATVMTMLNPIGVSTSVSSLNSILERILKEQKSIFTDKTWSKYIFFSFLFFLFFFFSSHFVYDNVQLHRASVRMSSQTGVNQENYVHMTARLDKNIFSL